MNDHKERMQRVLDEAERFTIEKEPTGSPEQEDPMAMLQRFFVTSDQVQRMKATELIWRGVIAKSHLSCWAAPGNGGKTTIARLAASELVRAGFEVLFFQEDAGAGDLPMLHCHAESNGYRLLNSTLNGSDPDDQIQVLRTLIKTDRDLSSYVFFFDTLKKYTDLMNKRGASEFFRLMRGLTQRGATVILLGHVNKHPGPDGKRVFEGVGDVRNDVDELIYLEAGEKCEQGLVVVTLTPDKVRSAVKSVTFEIDTKTLHVRPMNVVVDIGAERQRRERLERDEPVIFAIQQALSNGGMSFETLAQAASTASGKGLKAVRAVVARYASKNINDRHALWVETRMALHNTRHISLRPQGTQ